MSTIMVVDDDREMGRLLCTLFELEGHKVVVVPSYQEVLPVLRQTQPDVVLMDVRVQNQETFGLMRQIRRDAALARVPVAMTSGMDCRRECLAAGADLFIMKPFLPDEVVGMIGDLLENRSGEMKIREG